MQLKENIMSLTSLQKSKLESLFKTFSEPAFKILTRMNKELNAEGMSAPIRSRKASYSSLFSKSRTGQLEKMTKDGIDIINPLTTNEERLTALETYIEAVLCLKDKEIVFALSLAIIEQSNAKPNDKIKLAEVIYQKFDKKIPININALTPEQFKAAQTELLNHFIPEAAREKIPTDIPKETSQIKDLFNHERLWFFKKHIKAMGTQLKFCKNKKAQWKYIDKYLKVEMDLPLGKFGDIQNIILISVFQTSSLPTEEKKKTLVELSESLSTDIFTPKFDFDALPGEIKGLIGQFSGKKGEATLRGTSKKNKKAIEQFGSKNIKAALKEYKNLPKEGKIYEKLFDIKLHRHLRLAYGCSAHKKVIALKNATGMIPSEFETFLTHVGDKSKNFDYYTSPSDISRGSGHIDGTKVVIFPPNISFTKNEIYLTGSPLETIPKNLFALIAGKINSNLTLDQCQFTKMDIPYGIPPEGLTLIDCPKVTKIPDTIYHRLESLKIIGCDLIKTLPMPASDSKLNTIALQNLPKDFVLPLDFFKSFPALETILLDDDSLKLLGGLEAVKKLMKRGQTLEVWKNQNEMDSEEEEEFDDVPTLIWRCRV